LSDLNPSRWKEETDLEAWFSQTLIFENKIGHNLAILTLWCIWKQRKKAIIFRDCRKAEHALFSEIKDMCHYWSLAGGKIFKPLTIAPLPSVCNKFI
jgi:hypothetical protein